MDANSPSTQRKCEHNWFHTRIENFRWETLKGECSGYCFPLSLATSLTEKDSGHTMTTMALLETWITQGFNFVYVSWKHFRCTECELTRKVEYYVNPVFIDPSHFDTSTLPKKEKASTNE